MHSSLVADAIARARKAQRAFESYDQPSVDEIVTAVAWIGYKNAEPLAKLAVEETGIGNYDDKVKKNRRKTFGTLRDLKGAKSIGVIREDRARGITEIAKPMGVIVASTPVTNPAATPIHNMMVTLKGRNAIILAPHPKADGTCAELVHLVHRELDKLGAPSDIVQHFSLKAEDKAKSKERLRELMEAADLVLVTAGPANVKAAYRSGTPALGVGRGNAPVIVDRSADVEDAATKIVRSATFDNATSCSSENSLLIEDGVYEALVEALKARGGYLASPEEKSRLQAALWKDGSLNRALVAQSAERIADEAGIETNGARLLLVEEKGAGPDFPFSGEKIAPVVALYRWRDFNEALDLVDRILDYQGLGHSVGIHSANGQHIEALAHRAKVCRVLVNQAHCIGNGGDFENGLEFTLSLAAGTWGGNSSSDNITYRHFLNITRLARPIPPTTPSEEDLFGDYWKRFPDDAG
jgi:sulfoacetaldehyde dehydrogenase